MYLVVMGMVVVAMEVVIMGEVEVVFVVVSEVVVLLEEVVMEMEEMEEFVGNQWAPQEEEANVVMVTEVMMVTEVGMMTEVRAMEVEVGGYILHLYIPSWRNSYRNQFDKIRSHPYNHLAVVELELVVVELELVVVELELL